MKVSQQGPVQSAALILVRCSHLQTDGDTDDRIPSTATQMKNILTLGRRSGALRAMGGPTASMLAATLATEGDCTMPPKLM